MFEEEEEVEETVAEKTHRLQERILELNSLIHAVEIPLVASGYLAKASHISGIPQNGIRINNQLSFRGLQKSQEYYRAINDANQTSAFDFEGFRAMKSLTSPWGIVHGTETKKWESWKMFMADAGVPTTEKGCVSEQGFLNYRTLIEPNVPLTAELESLELGMLPIIQIQWARVKVLLKEIIELRHITADAAASNTLIIADELLTDDLVNLEDISFVLANCGLCFSKYEFFRHMVEKASFDRVMENLILKSLKKNYAQSPQRYAKRMLSGNMNMVNLPLISVSDMNKFPVAKFVAWVFGRRPNPCNPDVYQRLIGAKYMIYRGIREWYRNLQIASDMGAHIKQRKLFLDFKHEYQFTATASGYVAPKTKDKLVDAKRMATKRKDKSKNNPVDVSSSSVAAIEQVDEEDDEEHENEEKPKLLPAPSDANKQKEKQAAIYKKLLPPRKPRKGIKELAQTRSAFTAQVEVGKSLSGALQEHATSITYKLAKLDKPDIYFLNNDLPRDCASAVVIDMLLRSEVEDQDVKKACTALKLVLQNNFGDEFARHPFFRGIFVFPAVSGADDAQVLRVCFAYKKMSVDAYLEGLYIPFCLHELFPDFRGEFGANVHISEILFNSSASLDNMLVAKFEFVCQFKRDIILLLLERLQLALASGFTQQQMDNMTEEGNYNVSQMNLMAKSTEEEKADAADHLNHNSDPWHAIRPYFPVLSDWCGMVQRRISGTKDANVTLKLNYLSEFLTHFGLTNPWLKTYLPPEFAKNHGSVSAMFTSWTTYFSSGVNAIFAPVKEYLEGKVANEEKQRRKQLISSTAQQAENKDQFDKKKTEMLERLMRLGIKTDEGALYEFEGKDNAPLAHCDRLKDKILESDLQALQTWERLWGVCLGVHTVDIVSGKSIFSIGCHGVDIMELFPSPPPITQVKTACDARRKRTASPKNVFAGKMEM